MLRKSPDNPLSEDLYKPLREAVDAAAAAAVGTAVPVDVDDDAQKAFRAVCVRRS